VKVFTVYLKEFCRFFGVFKCEYRICLMKEVYSNFIEKRKICKVQKVVRVSNCFLGYHIYVHIMRVYIFCLAYSKFVDVFGLPACLRVVYHVAYAVFFEIRPVCAVCRMDGYKRFL